MPDGSAKIDSRTLRTHILDAGKEIAEIKRQISERKRFSIPTFALEEALAEAMAARAVLQARLTRREPT
jgi:hypothetical protein